MCVSEALLDFFLEPFVALPVQGVPQENRGVPISASHDRGVPRGEVLDIPREGVDVLQPCYLDPTRHRATHKLVARNTHAPNRFLEADLWSLVKTEKNSTDMNNQRSFPVLEMTAIEQR